jgi:hypothetical protein
MSKRNKRPENVDSGRSEQTKSYNTTRPTFETKELRYYLSEFLNRFVIDPVSGEQKKVGDYKWGVYAFYDYDGEPIYVGQTNERLRARIQRHLTNQRTDAVAMNVLDPFEVFEVAIWPVPQYEGLESSDKAAKAHLDTLEYAVYHEALKNSKFGAILNEKPPPKPTVKILLEAPIARGRIVPDNVLEIRGHPDYRIARRSATLARLAQVISERQVKPGLRRALLTQAKRLRWLAERRIASLEALGVLAEEETDENKRV